MADTFITRIEDGLADLNAAVKSAAQILKNGGICAIPTETVYGLAANAFDATAVAKIFEAKGRPQDNPLICHISDIAMLKDVATYVPDYALKLIENYWGGPLSIVLKKTDKIPPCVSGGLDTVAVRMPDHKLTLDIISECGFALAAPSANISGRPSPICAKDVYYDLNGKIPLIIDGGACRVGVESTVVDATGEIPVILRPGDITAQMIKSVAGDVMIHKGLSDEMIPSSPGMKYRHYTPNARIITYIGEKNAVAKTIMTMYYLYKEKACVICSSKNRHLFENARIIDLGEDRKSAQRKFFNALRQTDELGLEAALFFYEDYMGEAVKNRITKASAQIITI